MTCISNDVIEIYVYGLYYPFMMSIYFSKVTKVCDILINVI